MNFLQRLKDGANKATEKAQNVVEINKLNSQISDIEHKKQSYYTEMGKVFYEGYRSEDMSFAENEMVRLAKSCDELQEEIEELRSKIAMLKNERLCQCGRTVSLDALYCPYCGSKLEDRQAPAPAQRRSEPQEEDNTDRKVLYSEELTLPEDEAETFIYRPEAADLEQPEEKPVYEPAYEPAYEPKDEAEYQLPAEEEPHRSEEERARERRHLEELERERERQLELDRRIRYWQENNQSQDNLPNESAGRDMVKCQICSADLPKGSKWCPRCGAEQI